MTFSSLEQLAGLESGDEQKRAEISVSAADPSRVYALCSGSTSDGGGLFGYYVSYDEGLTFNFECCGDGPGGPWEEGTNPNILGWSGDGTGDGGQYYYDLAHGASPTDADKQFSAGISGGGLRIMVEPSPKHWVWFRIYSRQIYPRRVLLKSLPDDGSVDMWVADGGFTIHLSKATASSRGCMDCTTDFWGYNLERASTGWWVPTTTAR